MTQEQLQKGLDIHARIRSIEFKIITIDRADSPWSPDSIDVLDKEFNEFKARAKSLLNGEKDKILNELSKI